MVFSTHCGNSPPLFHANALVHKIISIMTWFSESVWKKLSGLHRALMSTPSKTFRMKWNCKLGLIAPHQPNGSESLQPGYKVLQKNFQEEQNLSQQHINHHGFGATYATMFTQTNLGEYRRTRHLTTIQWRHWALHLGDNDKYFLNKASCLWKDVSTFLTMCTSLCGSIALYAVCTYPQWGLRQRLDQGGAMRKGLRGFGRSWAYC